LEQVGWEWGDATKCQGWGTGGGEGELRGVVELEEGGETGL